MPTLGHQCLRSCWCQKLSVCSASERPSSHSPCSCVPSELALKWGRGSVCDSVGQWKLCLSPGTSSECFTHVSLPRAWPTPCPLSQGAGPGRIGLASHLCESRAQSTRTDQATARFTDGTFGRHRDADRAPLPRHSPPHGRTLALSL